MEQWFQVQHLDVERLLANWRWLCPEPRTLIARSVFGHLFLADELGQIWWLDVEIGKLTRVAESEPEFHNLLQDSARRTQWFAEPEERAAASKGLIPNEAQCIGFEFPLVISSPGHSPKPYVADLYEVVSFLGDINEQIANVPDGTEVKLIIGPRPLSH